MKSTFHCELEKNFSSKAESVRGFIYNDYFIEPHKHGFYEINIIMSGRGTHLIEDNSFTAEAGDVFVIPPNIVHAYTNTKQMNVFHILIRPSLINSLGSEKDHVNGFNILMEIEPFLRNRCEKKMFLSLSPDELKVIKYDLDLIRDDTNNSFKNCNPLKNHIMIKILYYMSSLIYNRTIKTKNNYMEYTIISLLDYISNNYQRKISIDDLCKISNTSTSTLIRYFRKICGCTPAQYIIDYRINLAKKMIEENILSRTEIAHECGFYDLSHMERYLKSKS